MCDFCSGEVYSNASFEDDWTISLNAYFGNNHYIDIDCIVDLGELGSKTKTTNFKVHYCPMCGRKLD